MNKNYFTRILKLSIVALIVSLASCSKDDPKPSKMSLLTSHVWVFNQATPDNELSTDYAELFTTALTGVEITMNVDGTYEVGGTITGNGTWKLNDDETAIIYNEGTANEGTTEILKLDAANWWYPSIDEDNGLSVTLKYVKK